MLHGGQRPHAQQQAFASIGQQAQTQAAYLGYIDVFWALTLISAAAIPLALSRRKVKLGGPAPVH
jgi:DHA2 family multidrug resistance protein